MRIFNAHTSRDRRLDCVQHMLFNHIFDLKCRSKELDERYLSVLYRLLGLRESLLGKILNELEHHEKVVVRFDCISQGGHHSIKIGVFHADELRWDDLFEGLEGNISGLCISFGFGKGKEDEPWYFADEKQLRGRVLAKVFDI